MSLDDQISNINRMISETSRLVFAGDTPDLTGLEKDVSAFLEEVQKMKAHKAKDYLNIVQIWSVEIRKMSEKLVQTKNAVQAEMNQSQKHNKGHMAYASSNFLGNKDNLK